MALAVGSPEEWQGTWQREFEQFLNAITFFPLADGLNRDPLDIVDAALPTSASEGFLWRLGGEKSETPAFTHATIGPDGSVYATVSLDGIWVFDKDGNFLRKIETVFVGSEDRVKMGPDGNLYLYSENAQTRISVFSQAGDLRYQFGTEGTGAGQFNRGHPRSIAIGRDGKVYALDVQLREDGKFLERIHIFGTEGQFLATFPLMDRPADPSKGEFGFGAQGISLGPDGVLHVVGVVKPEVLRFTPTGSPLEPLPMPALAFTNPRDMAFDNLGQMYFALQSPPSIIKTDAEGQRLASFGRDAETDQARPEAQFFFLRSVNVSNDGLWGVTVDWSQNYTYLTVFEFSTSSR